MFSSFGSSLLGSCQQVTARRTSAFISVPRSKCTRVTLRDPESVASTEQDGNRRCGNIGSGRDPSNSDTTRRERDGSRCEPMGQSCTSQSTTRALRTPRALPRQCLLPNRPRRMSGDRFSSHAPTCSRGHHRRVDRRHAGLTDTGFHQIMFALRTRPDATCQLSRLRNLRSQRGLFSENSAVAARNLSRRQCAGTRKWSRA
jgi:hypothetical protein